MKFFTLPTCKTCQRIDADLQPAACGAEIRDIKASGITAEEVDAMKGPCGQLRGALQPPRDEVPFHGAGRHGPRRR